MNSAARRTLLDRVLVDMNTQCDFLLPIGAVPVANRIQILPNIRRLMTWARLQGLPIISTLECHRPAESANGLPPHCIDRTAGQRKLPFTLMPKRIILHGDNTLDLPLDPFRRYQQLIFTKRMLDFLSNPKADRLINSLSAKCLIVFGNIAEKCVKAAVLGLLTRRHRTVVVADACGFWCPADADLAFRQMEAKGALLVTAEQLCTGAADDRIYSALCMSLMEKSPAPSSLDGNGTSRNKKLAAGLELTAMSGELPPARPGNGRRATPLSEIVPPALPPVRRRRASDPPKSHRGLA
jgi:nicotinamidase-related amidase